MEANLRKWESTLIISGTAVFLFGFWSMLKLIINLLISPSNIEGVDLGTLEHQYYLAVIIILIVMTVIDCLLRLYIGLKARKRGRAKDKGILFLILGIIIGLLNIYSLVSIVQRASTLTIWQTATSFLVECTSIFAITCVVVAAIRVGKLRKRLEKGE